MDRRSMLALTGTALATALAGCNAVGNASSPTDTDAPTASPTNTPTDAPTASPTDVHTPTPTASPTDGHAPPPTESPTATRTDEGTTTDEPAPDVPNVLVNGSFEADWGIWTVGRHLPEDPNREGAQAVASEVGVTTTDATDGQTSCRIAIDGSQDDGTVWVQQPVDLSDHDYLAVDYGVSDSFNQIRKAAVYAGPELEKPLTETDFDTSKSLEGHETPGWKTFTYEVDHDGPGLVAVGWSVVWETRAAALFDDVRLSAEEPSIVTPSPPGTTDSGGGSIN